MPLSPNSDRQSLSVSPFCALNCALLWRFFAAAFDALRSDFLPELRSQK